MTIVYHVTGMSCDGCVQAVTNAIKLADPQASVAVELSSGEISIDGRLDDDAIAAAIDGAGFIFDGRIG